MRLDVPFYANTDNTHCVQAVMKMVLKYFYPEKDFSFEELDKASNKQPGKGTWPYAYITWMAEQGLEVVTFGIFDTKRFVENPEEYMFEFFGEEKTKNNLENSDIPQVVEDAKKYLTSTGVTENHRIPTIDDIKQLMQNGYVPSVGVNSRTLNNKPGYKGHRVIVSGFNNDGLLLNDPGGKVSGVKDRPVDYETFEKAWAYPDENQKGIMAFKLKN